eukprot:793294-Amphidinium_carterae.1
MDLCHMPCLDFGDGLSVPVLWWQADLDRLAQLPLLGKLEVCVRRFGVSSEQCKKEYQLSYRTEIGWLHQLQLSKDVKSCQHCPQHIAAPVQACREGK